MNFFPPQVEARQTNVQLGDSIAFSNMFSASDLDGNPIQTVRFRDSDGVNTTGFFTIRGERQPAGVFIEVDFSEINLVRYQSGLTVSSEAFSVQVGDGERFSTVDLALVNTIPQNFFPPTIQTFDREIQENESIAASSFINVTDPENNPILRYFVSDSRSNANGGFFELNGTRLPSAQFFLVEAEDFENLRYVGGRFNQEETVRFQAFDGEFFSEIATATATTGTNQFAPVVTTFNVNTGLGRSIAAASLFSFSDADGNAPVTYGFRDTGTAPGTGFFTVNGAPQEAGTFFFIPANQLNTVRYEVSDAPDSEVLQIFATDGRFASEVTDLTVTALPRPDVNVLDSDVVLNTLERVDIVNLVELDSGGPPFELFQVFDQADQDDATPARLVLDGDFLERGVTHTFTPEEFTRLQVQGGFSDFRSSNQFLVRGRNERFFSNWAEVRVNTEINLLTALDDGRPLPDSIDNGEKFVVTYTFIDGVDPFDDNVTTPPVPSYYPDDSDFRDDPFPLNGAQRLAVRAGFDLIEGYADLEFVEVPFTPDAAEAQFTFGLSRGLDDNVLGVSLSGGGTQPGDTGNIYGDIWFNRDFFPETGTPTQPGSQFFETALHEIGHSLGFQHPFAGAATVPNSLNFTVFSLLAANSAFIPDPDGGVGFVPVVPESFGLYEIAEVQELYRPNEEFNLGNTHYFFTNQATVRTINDAGGRDTINLTNTFQSQNIDLHEGAFTSVNGNPFAVAIAFGTTIENARGGGGADTLLGNSQRNLLFGNVGADTLEGDGGNDVLRGGGGDDTYVWRLGDGRDRIDEQDLGGSDVLEIIDDTALSSLENDFVFRRFGNNLRIDLRFDRNEAEGSVRLRNQNEVGSQVETLRLFNTNGDQIGEDIDLNSIFQQANTGAQFFTLSGQETENGFIAIPTV